MSLSAPPCIGHPAFPLSSVTFPWPARAKLAYYGYGFAEYLLSISRRLRDVFLKCTISRGWAKNPIL